MNATSFFRLGRNVILLLGLFAGGHVGAQTPAEVRAAFKNLRDDKVRDNCGQAAAWLMARREALKGALVTELYQTDWQGRDAIMFILFETASFVPDDRFNQFIMFPGISKEAPLAGVGPNKDGGFWVGSNAWKFIDAHYDLYESQLAAQISGKTSARNVWIATWFFKKHQTLTQHLALYTPEVLDWLALALISDGESFNASQAIRTFLILGESGVPALQRAAQSSNSQASSLAKATLDAMKGNRDAFGFLRSRAYLSKTPFGLGSAEPDWLSGLMEANLERAKYP